MNKNVFVLSFVVALRFFGLFVVMPLLSLYAITRSGSDQFLVGIVMGGYAVTQLIFQIPFGMASDKYGRRKVIFAGLLLFVAGSVICAEATDIYTLVFGRLLQGAGAISSVVTAMISDFTKEEKRAKAMAMMGGSIALSFMAAMIVGPYIGGHFGVDKLFWLTAVLAALAMLVLLVAVPEAPKLRHHAFEEKPSIAALFGDKNLARMYFNMFLHGFLLSVVFMIVPIELTQKFGWNINELWKVYVLAMGCGFLAMAPAAIIGEKYGRVKEVFLLSILINSLAFIAFGATSNQYVFIGAVVLFFIGFNMLEPLLQSTTSKYAKASQRGSALAVFTSFQYLGVFLGGAVGGLLLHASSLEVLTSLMFVLSFVWFVFMIGMKNPLKASFLYLSMDEINANDIPSLRELDGVVDSYINETEGVLVIKYDPSKLTEEYLEGFLKFRSSGDI